MAKQPSKGHGGKGKDMANDKDGKGSAPEPGGTDGDGKVGNDPVGAGKGEGAKAAVEWDALSDAIFLVERAEGPHGRRICLVRHPSGPGLWMGTFGNAPVEDGEPAYVLSDGTEVTL